MIKFSDFFVRIVEWEHTITDLSINLIIDKMFQFLGKEFNCKNIYWLKTNEFYSAIQQIWTKDKDIINTSATPNIRKSKWTLVWQSNLENSLDEIFLHWKDCAPDQNNWKDCLIYKRNEKNDVLLPLLHPHNKQEILGYFILEQTQVLDDNSLQNDTSFLRDVLARNFFLSMKYQEAIELTYRDDLSALYNQRYLSIALNQTITQSKQDNSKFSILFIDVDNFKGINDSSGHVMGSHLLSKVSEIIRSGLRGNDIGFRYGGDEFLIILPSTDITIAHKIAERLRKKIEQNVFTFKERILKLTVSIGISSYPEHADSLEELVVLADQAMYMSKERGRNLVYLAHARMDIKKHG